MQKISYMGDGTNKEFTFNFPFFENTNIVVTKNNTVATGYNIVGTSGGVDADIPYVGGKVVFETAPTVLDSITIARQLPLTRVVDYQPTAKVNPTNLNQDMNYMMEVLKDMQDELDGFNAQYADITNQESTSVLLTKIAAISQAITNVSQQITALGDISTLRQSVTTNSSDITTLQGIVANPLLWCYMPGTRFIDLDTQNNGLYTAPENGYIWLQSGQTSATQLFVDVQDANGNLLYSDGGILDYGGLFVPIAKGNVALIRYTAKQYLRFVYAINAPNA